MRGENQVMLRERERERFGDICVYVYNEKNRNCPKMK